jgi:hypothetical protein
MIVETEFKKGNQLITTKTKSPKWSAPMFKGIARMAKMIGNTAENKGEID